ncbi:MAG: aminoacyl-tRNA hydrolase [Oscillospiraceae bacterium]|nr:aminoacyl-tRNA hydrolase [Oscillospiraceae bacterium]
MGLFSSPASLDWIVVFLGNPGPRYQGTRHNAGFLTADACEKDTGALLRKVRFHALTDRISLAGNQVLLMKPQTCMNLSGDAAGEAAAYFKVPPERVIVVSDDVALPVAKLRVRRSGSAGGHNGLKSVIARLGSDRFPRVRIGVGAPPHPDYDMADWVLGVFRDQDAADMAAAAERAWEAVKCYITDGPERCMAKYN